LWASISPESRVLVVLAISNSLLLATRGVGEGEADIVAVGVAVVVVGGNVLMGAVAVDAIVVVVVIVVVGVVVKAAVLVAVEQPASSIATIKTVNRVRPTKDGFRVEHLHRIRVTNDIRHSFLIFRY